MARPRVHLNNAPIVEAVIDLRVIRREGISAEAFANVNLGTIYTQSTQLQAMQARFGFESGGAVTPTTVTSVLGWQYQGDGYVAQFRLDGFTLSKLEPYSDWDQVFAEARRLWGLYISLARPLEISRAAVRYINRLRVPAPADLRQYLEAPPTLPPPIPQVLREFLCRVLVDDTRRGLSAYLVQALEPSLDQSSLSILLDIDAFRDVSLQPEDPILPELFGQLRALKNEIFYASVTENTVEMYA
jgi:uncharacterized protein (TIGR04255 family)